MQQIDMRDHPAGDRHCLRTRLMKYDMTMLYMIDCVRGSVHLHNQRHMQNSSVWLLSEINAWFAKKHSHPSTTGPHPHTRAAPKAAGFAVVQPFALLLLRQALDVEIE